MERNHTIDIVRCLAVYLIIILHAGSAACQYAVEGTVEYNLWISICNGLCSVALPTLFFISGYLFYKGYRTSVYVSKIKRRVKRLFVPYVMWNTTLVLFFLAAGSLFPRVAERVASYSLDSFSGAFDKILSLTTAPMDGPLWFIRALFIYCVIAPILWPFLRKRVGRYIGILAFVALYATGYGFNKLDLWAMTCPLWGLTIFYLGGLLASVPGGEQRIRWFHSPWWLPLCIAGLAFSVYMTLQNKESFTTMECLWDNISKILMIPSLFYVLSHFDQERISDSKVYLYLKEMSFFAYAGHFLFCSMLIHTLAPKLGFITCGKFTLLVIIFVGLGIPLMAAVYGISRRYFKHVVKLYDGNL